MKESVCITNDPQEANVPIIAGAVSKGSETRVSKIRTRVATQKFSRLFK